MKQGKFGSRLYISGKGVSHQGNDGFFYQGNIRLTFT